MKGAFSRTVSHDGLDQPTGFALGLALAGDLHVLRLISKGGDLPGSGCIGLLEIIRIDEIGPLLQRPCTLVPPLGHPNPN